MHGLIAGSRGGKDNIQGWTGLSLTVEVGRQHPRMDGLIAGSRGGKTTSKDGRVIAGSRGGKITSKDARAYR